MLIAIIWLSIQSETPSTDISAIYQLNIPVNIQLYLFLAFMLAYAIKIPVFLFIPGNLILTPILHRLQLCCWEELC